MQTVEEFKDFEAYVKGVKLLWHAVRHCLDRPTRRMVRIHTTYVMTEPQSLIATISTPHNP